MVREVGGYYSETLDNMDDNRQGSASVFRLPDFVKALDKFLVAEEILKPPVRIAGLLGQLRKTNPVTKPKKISIIAQEVIYLFLYR